MHRLQRCALAIVTLLAFTNAACVETLPPEPAPTQAAVPLYVPLLPPAPGKGRVLFDATNGPARVDEIVGHESGFVYGRRGAYASESEIAKPVCTATPCAVNLDYGEHALRFTSIDDDDIHEDATTAVPAKDSAFVSTMGTDYPGGALHAVGLTLLGFGIVGTASGGALTVIGDATEDTSNSPGAALLSGGEVTLGIGLGLAALGIVLAEIDHPKHQEGAAALFPVAN